MTALKPIEIGLAPPPAAAEPAPVPETSIHNTSCCFTRLPGYASAGRALAEVRDLAIIAKGSGIESSDASSVEPKGWAVLMKWKIELKTVEGDERLLRDILNQFKLAIVDEEGARFVVSDTFDAFDGPRDVRKIAQDVRSVVEKVTGDDADIRIGFTVGNVFERKQDGSWGEHKFVEIGPATLAITGHAGFVGVGISVNMSDGERKRIEEENKEREYQRLRRSAISRIVSAYRDDRALQVQRLMRGELTPLALGHIVEIIESDVGAGMRDFASANQLTRFNRSINHPEVFGDQARHGVSNQDPPPKPMGLEEARTFIRDIATRWMDRKSGLS